MAFSQLPGLAILLLVTAQRVQSAHYCQDGSVPICRDGSIPRDFQELHVRDDSPYSGGQPVCPRPCDPHHNYCDAMTAPTCIFPDPRVPQPRAACACRPGYKTSSAADDDTRRQWRLPVVGQEHRVWVAEGIKCDALCADVTILPHDCVDGGSSGAYGVDSVTALPMAGTVNPCIVICPTGRALRRRLMAKYSMNAIRIALLVLPIYGSEDSNGKGSSYISEDYWSGSESYSRSVPHGSYESNHLVETKSYMSYVSEHNSDYTSSASSRYLEEYSELIVPGYHEDEPDEYENIPVSRLTYDATYSSSFYSNDDSTASAYTSLHPSKPRQLTVRQTHTLQVKVTTIPIARLMGTSALFHPRRES